MISTRTQDRLAREAADWFARLNARRVSVADLEAFRVWKAIPQNRSAYEAIESVWRDAGDLANDADIVALTAAAARRRKSGVRSGSALRLVALASASTLVIVSGAAFLWASQRPEIYATDQGERRAVRLADGSTLELDAATEVRVKLRESGRELQLLKGQALFVVAHDLARPFRVTAGETVVQATGTRFDVRRDRLGARVVLVEGGVTVAHGTGGATQAWRLRPGQQLVTGHSDAQPVSVDLAAALSWTDGRLIFNQTPLASAVADVNRYGEQPLVLGKGVDHELPISGAFDTGDSLAFAEAVSRLYGLAVQIGTDEIVLVAAPARNKS